MKKFIAAGLRLLLNILLGIAIFIGIVFGIYVISVIMAHI